MINFSEFLNENKMWYKTISQMLDYVDNLSQLTWIFLDTETTGLLGPINDQLTQISAIAYKNNIKISEFNQKILLNDDINSKLDIEVNPGWNRRKVLLFNHYDDKINDKDYLDENVVLDMFKKWVYEHKNIIFIIQNAEFDMEMLNGRNGNIFNDIEVIDTKMLIQLYIIPLYQKLSESDEIYKNKLEKIGRSSRDNGLISSSMSKWAPEFNIDVSNYHDALFDCEMMKEMTDEILDIMSNNKNVDIMKYQIERIKTLRF